MPFKIPWPRSSTNKGDPFWDFFIHHAPADPGNLVAEAIRTAPEGNIYPTRTEVHSPDITASHLKELARFWQADEVGIVRLAGSPAHPEPVEGRAEQLPYAMVFGFYTDYDPKTAPGIGGQHTVLKGAYVAFEMGAYIREMGYQATRTGEAGVERLAATAGLKAPPGKHLYLTDILQTDLPLAADGEATWQPTS